MTEEELQGIHVNHLYKLLAKHLNELIGMERNNEDKLAIKAKQQEVELIQKVLLVKTIESPPGTSL